jgi:hypothetical protein
MSDDVISLKIHHIVCTEREREAEEMENKASML